MRHSRPAWTFICWHQIQNLLSNASEQYCSSQYLCYHHFFFCLIYYISIILLSQSLLVCVWQTFFFFCWRAAWSVGGWPQGGWYTLTALLIASVRLYNEIKNTFILFNKSRHVEDNLTAFQLFTNMLHNEKKQSKSFSFSYISKWYLKISDQSDC